MKKHMSKGFGRNQAKPAKAAMKKLMSKGFGRNQAKPAKAAKDLRQSLS